jgi:hypothetical protein
VRPSIAYKLRNLTSDDCVFLGGPQSPLHKFLQLTAPPSKMELCLATDRANHRVHIFTRDETGLVHVCPLSWSGHCNFTGDGKCNERGRACTPHPHQPGLILPSWLNVRQKAAVATLCTLCPVALIDDISLWPPAQNKSCCYSFRTHNLDLRIFKRI